MKKLLLPGSIAIAAVLFVFAPAQASEGEAWCQEFTSASGISDAPCACVVEAVESDADLAAELYSYGTRDEYEANASSALRDLIGPCVPE